MEGTFAADWFTCPLIFKRMHMNHTRRSFGKLALASFPIASVALSHPRIVFGAEKRNSKFNGAGNHDALSLNMYRSKDWTARRKWRGAWLMPKPHSLNFIEF